MGRTHGKSRGELLKATGRIADKGCAMIHLFTHRQRVFALTYDRREVPMLWTADAVQPNGPLIYDTGLRDMSAVGAAMQLGWGYRWASKDLAIWGRLAIDRAEARRELLEQLQIV